MLSRLNDTAQGLLFTHEDGPTMQLWPIQHDFFTGQNRSIFPQSTSEDRPDRIGFSSTTGKRLAEDSRTNMGSSHQGNWNNSWDWDGFLFRAQPIEGRNILQDGGSAEFQVSQHRSPSSREDSEVDKPLNKPATLELGLGNNPSPAEDNDSLLALTLGGPDELPPDAKRSRHSPLEVQKPRCQVDNCTADLQNAKDYHRRHKVCEFHSKAPKAPVNRIMQRFCQQCSRFHMLQEFDDDRRSCRRRLAGHNRRRRKAQPDPAATAALASLLGNPSILSQIINPIQQLQGKDELERLLRLLNGGDVLLNSLSNVKTCTPGVAAEDLINAITKSQILSNLLRSDTSSTSSTPAAPVPTDSQISNLSSLLLEYLQQKKNGNKENGATEKQAEACTSFRPSQQQDSLEELQPNKSNGCMENAFEERTHSDPAQTSQSNVNNNLLSTLPEHLQSFPVRERIQVTANHMLPNVSQDARLKKALTNTSLSKQHQTFQLWFKIFDRSPAELPSSLRSQMLEWLDNLPTDMEGYIRPGCIILTVFVCMPVQAWERLCSDIEISLDKLLKSPGGDFWCKGRVFVRLGDVSALIVEGNISCYLNPKPYQSPNVVLVQPFAVSIGEDINFVVKGQNLNIPNTKFICSYEGKCIEKEVNILSSSTIHRETKEGTLLEEPYVQEEQAVSFNMGPFNNIGHTFVEVEGQDFMGNSFPVIIADASICNDVRSLETEYTNSLANKNEQNVQADIMHFLFELGWLLQRSRLMSLYKDLGAQEFSPSRYKWLLQFSVEHQCCAVVTRTLDLLFSADGSSEEHLYFKAVEILSEASLLHIAVKRNSKDMVEALLKYSPPIMPFGLKQQYIFRPDTCTHRGLTPLHIAASIRDSHDILDALTNAPEELWATAWTSAKDSVGQTPQMYALSSGNHANVHLVQRKLEKLNKAHTTDKSIANMPAPHLALNIINPSSSKVPCTCKQKQMLLKQNLPVTIYGLNMGSTCRPFVLTMLAIAAVCVCVGILMKGPPSVNFVRGPFVWDFIGFGAM